MVYSNQAVHTPFSRKALSRAPWVISSLLSLVLIIVSAGLTLGLPPGQAPMAPGVGYQLPPREVFIKVTVTPTILRFGYQPLGSMSPARSVLVTSADPRVYITSIGITGDDSGAFISSDDGRPGALPLNSTRRIDVMFHPKRASMHKATLTIQGNFTGSPYRVPLLGSTYPGPTMSFSLKELSFGRQEVLTRSAPRTVTVTNIGGSDLVISRVSCLNTPRSHPADFTVVSSTGHSSTALGDTRTFSIVFRPTGLDNRHCGLRFESNQRSGLLDLVPLHGWATPRK